MSEPLPSLGEGRPCAGPMTGPGASVVLLVFWRRAVAAARLATGPSFRFCGLASHPLTSLDRHRRAEPGQAVHALGMVCVHHPPIEGKRPLGPTFMSAC